jgi:uncharacterized protein
MTPGSAQQLDARLEAYEQQTHHQLIVWIGKTTGDASIEDWSAKAVKAWGVGRKGANDGLALIVMADDRKLRIEVGYGLEGQVPDIIANRIIRDVITPQLRSGNTGSAITAGMESIAAAIGDGPLPGSAVRDENQGFEQRPLSIFQIIFFTIVGILILGFVVTHPSLILMMLAGNVLGGGRRRGPWDGGGFGGGGFGGGGGFSGGGGYSGGGGASGSW